MTAFLLVVHVMISLALIGTVLLQRSEGGALGIGGGGGGFMSGRGAGNVLTRATAYLAAGFFVTSILLTIVAANSGGSQSVVSDIPEVPETTPLILPETPAVPAEPEAPASPVVPRSL